MVSVPTSLGEWIHSPWFDLGLVVWKGYRPRVRLVLAGGHASAWFSPFWRGPAPGAQRYQAVNVATNPSPLPRTERKRNIESELFGTRPIRWNTQAPTSGYDTFTERMAKRRRAT